MIQRKRHRTIVSLIIVAMICGAAQAAVTKKVKIPKTDQDPVQNSHLDRQLTQHSQREKAAKRLRLSHQKIHEQKIDRWVHAHHGYTGLGHTDGISLLPPQHAVNGGIQ